MEDHPKYWQANWQRELEGAFLYRGLSHLARTPQIGSALAEMGEQEEHHAEVWANRARQANPQIGAHRIISPPIAMTSGGGALPVGPRHPHVHTRWNSPSGPRVGNGSRISSLACSIPIHGWPPLSASQR